MQFARMYPESHLSRLMNPRFPINHSHSAKKRNLRCFVARRGWGPLMGTFAATPSRSHSG